MKRATLFTLGILLLGVTVGCIIFSRSDGVNPPQSTASAPAVSGSVVSDGAVSSSGVSPAPETKPLLPEDINSILDTSETVPLDTIPGSITILVNRNYLLPSTYTPTDLTEPNIRFSFYYPNDKRKLRKAAAKALEKMFQAAEKDNVILYGVSGYRSYARQKQIYDQNIAVRGKKNTDTVSARPGSSEHQTGLTIDISARSVACQLSRAFGNTKEGKWVAKNAHKYGFIVRYPDGKSKITGYQYEPWHIRFVGVTVATYLYKGKLTLEEYYGISCNGGKDGIGVDVEDPDNLKYATPKPSSKPRKNRK